MKIAVFGIGYVGVVSAACLSRDGHDVIAVDVDPAKIAALSDGRCPIIENGLPEIVKAAVASGRLRATADATHAVHNSDASFICVGTPSAEDGSVGLSYVTAVAETVGAALKTTTRPHTVIVRSTIVPGSTERAVIPALERTSGKRAGQDFGVGYFPEFLREGTAIQDYDAPGLIVYGSEDPKAADFLRRLNEGLGVIHHQVDIATAEMAKYTSNCWRAVKISFANEIGNLARANGLDGAEVMGILTSDSQIAMSPAFLRPGFAFGGSCLPKDLRALRHMARSKAVPTPILDAALAANAAQIARAEELIIDMAPDRVGLVGVAFKSDTDDLRESPLADLAGRLLRSGIEVKIWDPYVHEAFRTAPDHAGRGNTEVPDLQARLVPELDDLLAQSDAIVIGNIYTDVRDKLRELNGRPIVDLARIDPSRRSSEQYQGLCW